MADNFFEDLSLLAPISDAENISTVAAPQLSTLQTKALSIEENRQLKHAAIAKANAEKKAVFDAASLDKKLQIDRPQALASIEVDVTKVPASEFLNSDLPLTTAEKFGVYSRNQREFAETAKASVQAEYEGKRDRTAGEVITDTGTALLGTGAIGLGEAAYGVAELASRMNLASQVYKLATGETTSLDRGVKALGLPGSKGFAETREIINQSLMSDPAKYQKAAVKADAASRQAGKAERLAAAAVNGKNTWWDIAKEEGGSFTQGLKALADNPIELTNMTLESGLMMFVPGAIASKAQQSLVKGMAPNEALTFLASKEGQDAAAKLATTVGVSTTAVLEGMSNAVTAKGEVLAMDVNDLAKTSPLFARLVDAGMSPEEARMQVSENVFDSVAAIAATIGGVASKVTGAGKLEGTMFKSATGSAAAKTAEGLLREGAEETAQSIGGQFAQNVATQQYVDPNQELTEGLGQSAAAGLAAGSLSGAAVTGVTSSAAIAKEKATETIAKRQAETKEQNRIKDTVISGIETGDYSGVANLSDEDKEKALATIVAPETLANPKLQMDREALTKHLDAGREIILKKRDAVLNTADTAQAELDQLVKDGVSEEAPEYVAAKEKVTTAIEAVNRIQAELKTFANIRKASKIESGTLKEALFQVSKDSDDAETKTTLTNIIRNMGSSLDSFDDADLGALAQNKNKQAAELAQSALNLRSVIAAEKDNDGLKSSAEVNIDVTQGTDKYRGVETYLKRFQEAVATDNKDQATKILNNTRFLLKRNQERLAAYKPKGKESPAQQAYRVNLENEKVGLTAALDFFQKAHSVNFGAGVLESTPVTEKPVVKIPKAEKPKTVTEQGSVEAELSEVITELTGRPNVGKKAAKTLKDVQAFFDRLTAKAAPETVKARLEAYKQGIRDGYNNVVDEVNTDKDYKAGVEFIFKNGVAYHTVSDLTSKSIKRMPAGDKTVSRAKMYLTKAKTSSTKNPNLQLVPNLATKINSELKSNNFELLKDLSDDEILTMDSVDSFTKTFIKQFDRYVKLGKIKDGIFQVFDKEIALNPALDLVTETVDEQGNVTYSIQENVKTALAVSLFDWLTSAPEASSKYSTDERINSLLGRDREAPVSAAAYELLWEAGVYANTVESELGKSALKSLGAQVVPTASAEYKAKLTNALGKWALNLASSMGYVEYGYVDTKALMALNGQTPAAGEKVYATVMVKPKFTDGLLKDEHSTFIAQMLKTPGVLTKVYGIEPLVKMPVFEMPTKVRHDVNNSNQPAPKALAEKRLNHEQKAHVVRKGMLDLVSNLSDGLLELAAGQATAEDIEAMHVTERRKAEVVNQEIKRTLSKSLPFIKANKDNTFYFLHDIWTNMRMGMSGAINMQANKIDRWLMANAAWKVTVSTDEQRNIFKQAVAAQFGVKIEEKTNEEIAVWFDKTLNNPIVANAVQAAKTVKSGNFTDVERANLEAQILAGVKEGGEKFGTLAAIEALTEYKADEDFETDLAIEIDGKTNGFIFSLIQYAGAKTLDQLKTFLERGGIFFDSIEDLSQWIKNPVAGVKRLDSYQTIALSWGNEFNNWSAYLAGNLTNKAAISKIEKSIDDKVSKALDNAAKSRQELMTKVNSISAIVGSFTDANGDVTKVARELSKDPLMTTNYGAGLDSIVDNFADIVVDRFYKDITKQVSLYNKARREVPSNAEDMRTALEKLSMLKTNMENVLGTTLKIDIHTAKDFVLTDTQTKQFAELLKATYGFSLRAALQNNFGQMLRNRRLITNALARASDLYAFAYKEEVAAQLKANNDAPITEAQHSEITKKLIKLFPSVRSYFSEKPDDYLQIGTFDRDKVSDDDQTENNDAPVFKKKLDTVNNQVKVEFNEPLVVGTDTRKSASSYVEIPAYEYTGVGVRGPALLIQSMDAATMVLTLDSVQALNNHDAIMVSVNDAVSGTQTINENFFKVNQEFGVAQEVKATLDRVINNFAEMYPEANPLLLEKAYSALNNLDSPAVTVDGQSLTMDQGRQAILKEITAVNQYTLNNGSFKPKQAKEFGESDIVASIDGLFSAPGFMSNFTESTGLVVDTVQTAVGVLDQLQASDVAPTTPEHMNYLRSTLAHFGNILKPLYLAIDTTKDKTLGRYLEGKKRIELQLNRTAPNGLLRGMSAAETFSHEMMHSFVKTAMDKQSRYTKKLKHLYDLAKANITPADLIERDAQGNVIANPTAEQIAAGQATWDYLFANPNVRKERVFNSATNMYEYVKSNDMFQEFIAYTATNLQLRDALKNNKALNDAWKKGIPKQRTQTTAESSVFKTIDTWLGQFLDLISNLITEFEFKIYGLSNVTADVGAMDLVYRAVNIQANHTSFIMTKVEKFADVNTVVIDKVSQWIIQPIAKFAAGRKKEGVIKDLATIVKELPNTSAAGLDKAMDETFRRFKVSEDALLMKLYREAQGATVKTGKFHILLRMSNTYIDRMRKNVATDVKRMLSEQFTRALEKTEKIAITRVLLKTDISTIMEGGYTLDQLKSLLTTPAYLQKEIDNLNKQITLKEYGKNAHFYIKQAASLGNYLALGFQTEKAGGLNAHVIANLYTTLGYGNKQGDVAKAEAIIDKLATLHALKLTDDTSKSVLAKLIESEPSGVDFVIQAQGFTKRDAKNRLFKRTPIQFAKGYTKEVLNPNVDVVVRPLSDAKQLAQEGYVFVKELPRDQFDPAPVMGQFVQKHKKMNSLLAGIVSYTHKGTKGTDLIQAHQNTGATPATAFGRAKTDGDAIKSKLKAHMADLFSSKMTATDKVNLVPVVSEKGFTAGYRYMMTEQTKRELLDKQELFDDILGVTMANVQDKLNTQIINEKLVETAKEDFDKYGVSEGKEFIAFGPGIGSKEHQELYNLMPDDMKKSIKKIWGSDTMYIRARNMDVIFGYRRRSAADFVPEFNNKVLNTAAEAVIRQLNRPGVRLFENAWQEVVTMAKDAIVIKTGTVLLFNVISNTVLLKLAGVPMLDIIKHHKTAFTATSKYQREQHELNALKMEVTINKKLSAAALKEKRSRIAFLENELSTNPMHELIKAGLYQTIVEDLSEENDSFTYMTELEEKAEKITRHIPQVVKDAGKLIAITHDTKLYKALRNTTQMSDFVARYTLHQHNLKEGMSGPESIANIMRTFIDYDPPTHPTVEYLNSMGLVMFTKYFIRIQRVLLELGIKKPGNILMLMLLENLGGIDIEDPYQSTAVDPDNFLNKASSPLNVVDAATSNNIFTLAGLY